MATTSLILAYLLVVAIPIGSIYVINLNDLFGTAAFSTILVCALWGAIGAFGSAYPINTAVMQHTDYLTTRSFLGPIVEEILKALIIYFFIWQPSFRYFVDGSVYGFATGVGFAVTENVFYLTTNPSAGLALALSRVVSTSLMHATTSAIIGISLGHFRRSHSQTRAVWVLIGFVPAIIIHMIFNNALIYITNPTLLLLFGVAIGIGGAVYISFRINQGIADEKEHFNQTLGLDLGVTAAEVQAIQGLGGERVEKVLEQLGQQFGEDKIPYMRRVLVLQANIGILQNNLSGQASDRLREAWQKEITEKRAEMDNLRKNIGLQGMIFMRNIFPKETIEQPSFQDRISSADQSVHKFDLFMNTSQAVGTLSPEELAATADILKQIQIFADVDLSDLENLSRAIQTRHFEDGELIFDQGVAGDEMFLVKAGAIALSSVNRERGTEKLLNTVYPGNIVGELALLDGDKRSARARALGSLDVLILRRDNLNWFIQSRPQVMLALLKFLAARARHVSDIVDMSIRWAGDIARGQMVETPTGLTFAAANAGAGQPNSLGETGSFRIARAVSKEAVDSTQPTSVVMQGLFSNLSSQLEQTEHMRRDRLEADRESQKLSTKISGMFSKSKMASLAAEKPSDANPPAAPHEPPAKPAEQPAADKAMRSTSLFSRIKLDDPKPDDSK